MGGICGVVFKNREKRLLHADIAPMVDALVFFQETEGHVSIVGSGGLGVKNFQGRLAGKADLTRYDKHACLVFHGNLLNLDRLFPMGGERVDPFIALLGLYFKEGMTFLKRLRGEFVLAIWDASEETLHLATDRFRIHQLLYYQDKDKLIFGSRMKSILACPFRAQNTIDPEAIIDVVGSSIIPTPKTIFKEIRKVPPGTVLTYRKGEIKLEPYWEASFLHPSPENGAELAEKFRSHLSNAISAQIALDGCSNEIGAFLSGGVDSSSVTGIMTDLMKHPIKAFSIGFDEQGFNEINYARIAAHAFGAEHYEYFVTPKDTLAAIPLIIDAFDEPFANASAIPSYYCAKMGKDRGVKALYAGDGGDELFAGNERYRTQRLFDYYYCIPGWLRRWIVEPLTFSLANALEWEVFAKAKKYILRANIPYPERITSYGFLKTVPMNDVFEADFLDTVGKDFDPDSLTSLYFFQAPARTNLDRHLYIDWKLALSDNDLIKVTRSSEAAGIAVRYPFLDHPLVEFAVTIPADMKMRGLKLRSFQKNACRDLLPREIRGKKKHGFGLPIPIWLGSDKRLNEMMVDLVLGPKAIGRGYLQKRAIGELVKNHKTDNTSFYGTVLWNLMILELWLQRHGY